MTQEEAVAMIDKQTNTLVNPVEMLQWVWLRVIINNIPLEVWNQSLERSVPTLSR